MTWWSLFRPGKAPAWRSDLGAAEDSSGHGLEADFGVLLIMAVVTVPILVIVALIMVLIN
ncbi:MAG: hypothetical protein K0R85_1975 [Devosia sp.]|jgi:hypothetical protein|nr:hypothetical protein [Devosia sp.]